ncbi:MAG TPA: zinc ribbon domain-containing protein [candidate division Zixibacteria bacterium]|nr:zinc ribbon domain-containing protein [candidate division Zixibacteria bacterium]
MALVKCKECGEQVSTKAKSCPKCGAIAPKKTSLFTWLVVIFIIYAIYAVNQSPTTPISSSKSTQTAQSAKRTFPKVSWTHSKSKDKMTGKESAYASSPIIEPTKKMDFPYSDTTAWLGVGCNGKSEWAYVGFSKAPNLTDTDTEDGYNLIRTRIKWDEKIENITLRQDWGASFIHFQDDESIISNIANSNSVMLELKWYGEQKTHFKFPLNGSSAALKNIRNLCSQYKQTGT